jgi:hypothetical protein
MADAHDVLARLVMLVPTGGSTPYASGTATGSWAFGSATQPDVTDPHGLIAVVRAGR